MVRSGWASHVHVHWSALSAPVSASLPLVLSEWTQRYGQPVGVECMWQVWPQVAVLLCHRAWDCLAWMGGHRSQPLLAPPGFASLARRGVTNGDLSCDKFAELATSLRHWYRQLVRAGVPATDDIRCSLAYFTDWAEWADHCERSFDVSDAFFQSRRGGRVVHPLPVLFMAMWTSYKLRADDLLAEVSREARGRRWILPNNVYLHNGVFLVSQRPMNDPND